MAIANKIECEKRGTISKSRNCIKWSASNANGNKPPKITYLTLNVAIPTTKPHETWPNKCSGEIPLTSKGFPTMYDEGSEKPKSVKFNTSKPINEKRNEHKAKRPEILIINNRLDFSDNFLRK